MKWRVKSVMMVASLGVLVGAISGAGGGALVVAFLDDVPPVSVMGTLRLALVGAGVGAGVGAVVVAIGRKTRMGAILGVLVGAIFGVSTVVMFAFSLTPGQFGIAGWSLVVALVGFALVNAILGALVGAILGAIFGAILDAIGIARSVDPPGGATP